MGAGGHPIHAASVACTPLLLRLSGGFPAALVAPAAPAARRRAARRAAAARPLTAWRPHAPRHRRCRDTAGQERYHSLAPMYYRGAAAAIVVFDITHPASFERAKKCAPAAAPRSAWPAAGCWQCVLVCLWGRAGAPPQRAVLPPRATHAAAAACSAVLRLVWRDPAAVPAAHSLLQLPTAAPPCLRLAGGCGSCGRMWPTQGSSLRWSATRCACAGGTALLVAQPCRLWFIAATSPC